MLHFDNDNKPRALEVELLESWDGSYVVEAIHYQSEGEIDRIVVSGPHAEKLARAIAARLATILKN